MSRSSTAPRSIRSLSRPGVAMSRSTPRFRALICGRVGQAAGDELVAQAEDVHERLERVGDLHGQLAGRHEDQRARATRARPWRRRRGGTASAGRRPASCRSRSGHGRGRPCRPGRPGWSRPGSGTASVMPSRARRSTSRSGRPRAAKPLSSADGHRRLVGRRRRPSPRSSRVHALGPRRSSRLNERGPGRRVPRCGPGGRRG